MEQLIKIVNKLQDAFAMANVANPIDLPQIVVIGSQSSGKSSVLENIVGRDFLPRGSGIVTRRPLILQLIHRPNSSQEGLHDTNDSFTQTKDKDHQHHDTRDEWGEFLHIPDKKFYDFNDIRKEIVSDTDAKTGHTKGVSSIPINLRIFSPNVLTLTLVDLPGLTKVPIDGQPHDIERQIRDMILKYISKNNAIVLAVTAANTDLANSDGLKLAREVDPEGVRTIGVLTKIDLMDPGTDVVDILAGRIIPLRLGYVPVVNRGQKDIDYKKSIHSALEAEKRFFEGHSAYQGKSQFCGTPFLARKLNMILMHHIKSTLPEIKLKITQMLQKYESELASLGDNAYGGGQNTILSIITEFCNEYRAVLDGQSPELSTTELNGGARISFVFHETFANAINAMDPFDQIKDVDIRTLLYNSSGSTPSLFVAASGFETLIKSQIRRLEEPSLKCVGLIYDELSRILTQLLQKPVFKRFPFLKERFYSSVIAFYKRCLDPTNKFVSGLVASESSYINTAHPDFLTGHRALAIVSEKLSSSATSPHATQSVTKGSTAATIDKDGKMKQQATSGTSLYPASTDGSLFGSFLSKKPISKPGVLETPPNVLKATGSLSEREYVEIEIIKLLLTSYFNIVKRTVSDLIPKSIMFHLVSYSKEEMQRALLADLYKAELSEELLKESDSVVSRRKEVKKMIGALQHADEIINSV